MRGRHEHQYDHFSILLAQEAGLITQQKMCCLSWHLPKESESEKLPLGSSLWEPWFEATAPPVSRQATSNDCPCDIKFSEVFLHPPAFSAPMSMYTPMRASLTTLPVNLTYSIWLVPWPKTSALQPATTIKHPTSTTSTARTHRIFCISSGAGFCPLAVPLLVPR